MSEQLDPDHHFPGRHIGPSDDEVSKMLAVIGVESVDALIDQVVPDSIRHREPLDLPAAIGETAATAELRELASANRPMTHLIGQGYAASVLPAVIRRNLLENPAWYTAYTPYQPEISQGRLEALLNFQTVITDLTGLELANASLLDEATAAAEAMTMAKRSTRRGDTFFVHADTHPQTIAVLRTRAEPIGVRLVVGSLDDLDEIGRSADADGTGGLFGALFSWPTSTGALVDWTEAVERVHELGGLAVVATDPLACVLLRSPGELGADIAVGSAQRFGVPLGYGGPHAGFIAARATAARSLPGRIVGVSRDTEGRPALRLALQTREQHIRREKATSNICTAQVLLANIASMYAVYHGADGLRAIARRVHRLTTSAAVALADAGITLRHPTWFDTVTIDGVDADAVLAEARGRGLNLRRVGASTVGITFDETSTPDTVAAVAAAFGLDAPPADAPSSAADTSGDPVGMPTEHRRTDRILTASVFHQHRSEHSMLRYLRRLADRDLALDRGMIPLGSCTMKLNATAEMEPIGWPEFADVHPFAPDDQTVGYRSMIGQLETWLAAITGYAAVSVQPNAGSQGELAGLLAIRRYHEARGDRERTVCLIPASAHGTNAASAVMAGLDVVVVACDDDGNVDLDDLRRRIAEAGDRLSAAMVTYPSTHGVFETEIAELCRMVHDGGGQVYVDGANLNALVGLARPGAFGADVSHLNLHKTFCIPHGGGGPGVGPIGVREHLVPFLPGDPLDDGAQGAVSAAPFGSAGILPISWMYLRMMGPDGLRQATEAAILAANYVAARLDGAFPVLYTGAHGRVAHECIVDIRPVTAATGITVDDVAKRLIDFGFHAPTMSFPVAGTLMIEPTESEDLAELDRFCDAMLAIRGEIAAIEQGEVDAADSPLRHAPHTAADVVADAWDRGYPRELGAFPLPHLRADKYFPPVSRIDGASGDRNLVCTCEPLDELAHR